MAKRLRTLILSWCVLASLTAKPALAQTIDEVDFTINPGSWQQNPAGDEATNPTPYGLSTNPTITGSFDVNASTVGPESGYQTFNGALITDLTLQTGNKSWSVGDVDATDTKIYFNANGSFDGFTLELGSPQSNGNNPNITISGNSSANVNNMPIASGGSFLSCNNCVTFKVAPASAAPEPPAWLLLAAGGAFLLAVGLFRQGTVLRTRFAKA